MNAYTSFAAVYDMFMDNIPYDKWCSYVTDLLKREGISDGLVLELGCGTGSVTRRLYQRGFDMIGIDNSQDMLDIAFQKKMEGQEDILYLHQDMREFELYGTVRAVISICDVMNYILDQQELLQVFRLVNNYLDPGGVFIFDMCTDYLYETALGTRTLAENREEGSFIWENTYHPDTRINEYELTFFVRDEDMRYNKYEETHFQKGYRPDEIKKLIEASGLEFVAVYDAFTNEPPKADCERFYIVAREQGKAMNKGV